MRALSTNPDKRILTMPPWCFWDKLFTEAELDKIVDYGDGLKLDAAGVFNRTGGISVARNIRKSQTAFFTPTSETSWIFEKLMGVIAQVNDQYYEFNLNGFSSIQYTVYKNAKANYSWHVDMNLSVNLPNVPVDHELRKLSMVLALSDPKDYKGGHLEIMTGVIPQQVNMPRGRVVLFPSFVLHRVTPLVSGIRKTLVAWVLGPKFQ